MFQGRGMGRFGGRESAASIPSPYHVITSCSTRFVCSFVCLFVCLFVWLVVALSLCPLSSSIPIPSHCHAPFLLLHLISRPCLIVALPRLVSPLSTFFVAWCQRQSPPLLIFHGLMGLHGLMFVRWRVWVHMFWFCDCKRMRKIPFSDVPQNSFKIWEK
jgi:hypothetical protein